MSLNRLNFRTQLPIEQKAAWNFFSDPKNLKMLTPDWLNMDIVEPNALPKEMFEGLIIEYQINPFPLITSSWITEITHVESGNYFIDEQRFGPYTFWHHLHTFETNGEGTLMTDQIHYILPGKFLGDLLFGGIVKSKLQSIFAYRLKKLEEMFPRTRLLS